METVTLSYQQPTQRVPRLRWFPAWLMALLALALGLYFLRLGYQRLEKLLPKEDLIGQVMVGAMFLPVWIKGRGVVRFSLAAGGYVLVSLALHFCGSGHHEDIEPGRAWAAVMAALVVQVAWFLPERGRRRRFLGRLALTILATAFVGPAVADWIEVVDAFSNSPGLPISAWRHIAWALLLTPWVYVTAIWAANWWLDREGWLRRVRWRDWLVWALLPALIALTIVYFKMKPRIAVYSLTHGGPFTIRASEDVIGNSDIPDSDLWRIIEASDLRTWAVPNWMKWAVARMVRRDPTSPTRFSALLRKHPGAQLADRLAPMLAQSKRYETIPILLRTSLFDDWGWNAPNALRDMNLPQAPWAIFAHEQQMLLFGTPFAEKVDVGASERASYAKLLGEDAGNKIEPWVELMRKKAHGRNAGIPDDICDEADRIVTCFDKYVQARTDLEHFVAGKLREAATTRPELSPADRRLIELSYPELIHPRYEAPALAKFIWDEWLLYSPGRVTGEVQSTDMLEELVTKYCAAVRKTIGGP